MGLKYWDKMGELFIQQAEKSWARNWDESTLHIEEDAGKYNIIFFNGEQGTPAMSRSAEKVVATEPSLEQATTTAKEFMKKHGDTVFSPDYNRDNFIIKQYLRIYSDDLDSKLINKLVAEHLNQNYNFQIEHRNYKTGDTEIVSGKVKTTRHNKSIILTSELQRDAIRSISKSPYDINIKDSILAILEEKEMLTDRTYRKLSKEYVYGDGDVPDIRSDLYNYIAEEGARFVVRYWESDNIRIHKKR